MSGHCPNCDAVQAQLDRVSYKPSWNFRIDHRGGSVTFDVDWVAEGDSTGTRALSPGDTMRITGSLVVQPEIIKHPDLLLSFFREAIQMWEKHEQDEWFKVDGFAPFHPHHR